MKKPSQPYSSKLLFLLLSGLLAVLCMTLWTSLGHEDDPKQKDPVFTELVQLVKEDKVSKLEVDTASSAVEVTEKEGDSSYVVGVPPGEEQGFDRLLRVAAKADVPVSAKPLPESGEGVLATVSRVMPGLLVLVLVMIGILYYTRSMNKIGIEPTDADVSFDDVSGCDEAIEELEDVRKFLSDPGKFEGLGARVPKGVLLYGPPGTGKTLLAKAVANEAQIPFFSASGSEFIEMFAGLGAKRVRALFNKAKEAAPSIIFIDELDAVGGHRSSGGGDGASREADQTLIQILKEMDGFAVSEHPVIVLGATNRLESLDRALVRPGRFDRQLAIDPPDRQGRSEILAVHARDKRISSDVDLSTLAAHTAGMTGADLALILNEAALLGARRDAEQIEQVDIDDAYFRVVAGAKKQNQALSDEERRTVAFHEVGHALIGERLGGSNLVHKISIIPRGRSGGQTLYVSADDVFLHSEEALKDHICGLLGGRAAEIIAFGSAGSGAADDLQKATDIAWRMITELGMESPLGLRVITDPQQLSEGSREKIDAAIKTLLNAELQRAIDIISADVKALETIASELLEVETIDRERFLSILEEVGAPSSRPLHVSV